jgi:hypothetical protein
MTTNALRQSAAPNQSDEISPDASEGDLQMTRSNVRRTSTKLIRFTPEELQIVTMRAAASGRPVACYIRENSLGAKLKPRPGAIADTLIYQLGRTATRLRALAASAATPPIPNLEDFQAALTDLLETIRGIE